MSTLDKAFIKAYQRHGISGPHAPFGRRPLPEAADAGGESRNRAAAVPPPHLSDLAGAASDLTPEKEPIADSKPLAQAEPNNANEPPVESDSAAADAGLDVLKPAFEIEQFKWPGVVPALIDNRQAQLASLLDELLPLGQGGLAVGGCRRGEGRTTVAMVVARQLVQTGARVVLVDADTERPKLAETLGTAAESGWIDALGGGQSAAEAMIESLGDRLVILPLKHPVRDASLAKHRQDMKRMLEDLHAAFDYVCLDMGPMVESRGWETALFESGVRAAAVVRDVRHCRLEQAQAVGRKFADLGAAHWTIIENFA